MFCKKNNHYNLGVNVVIVNSKLMETVNSV